MSVTSPPLVLRAATIGYDSRPVVHAVDLTVGPGEVVALLGANGSGKTTLVRGVLGLAPVLSGTIDVLGAPLARLRDRGRVGYVPQRHTVAGSMPCTVRELVSSGRLARRGLLGRPTSTDRAAVTHAIDAVHLTERADTDVARLSGGQQRRALIARALAGGPELLLMDEPTAGVDRASQAVLVRTLAQLVDAGVTLVVVTHEVGPLVPLLDRVVVLDEGRVTYDGPWQPAMLGAADGGLHHHPPDESPATPSWSRAVQQPLGER